MWKNLANRVGWSLVIEVLNLFTSAFIFLLLARYLSLEEYGRLGGLTAIAAIIGPTSTFGSNWRLIRNIVVSKDEGRDLGLSLSVTSIGTLTAILLVVLVSPLVIPSMSRSIIAIYLVGQLTAFWLIELAITFTVAKGLLQLGAGLRATASLVRVLGLLAFISLDQRDLGSWALVSALSGLCAALAVHTVLQLRTRTRPKLVLPRFREFRDGLPYAFGSTTEGFLAASDRPLLLSFGHDAAAGFYAAGYRLASLGTIPLMALVRAQDQRMFTAGSRGIQPAMEAGGRLAKLSLGVTLPVTIVLLAGAPTLASILPETFSEASDVMRVLSILPVIKGLQFAFGNVLSASSFQGHRVRMTIAAATVNLVGNLIFIPTGSWVAAATTTIVAESLLAGLLFGTAHILTRPKSLTGP